MIFFLLFYDATAVKAPDLARLMVPVKMFCWGEESGSAHLVPVIFFFPPPNHKVDALFRPFALGADNGRKHPMSSKVGHSSREKAENYSLRLHSKNIVVVVVYNSPMNSFIPPTIPYRVFQPFLSTIFLH